MAEGMDWTRLRRCLARPVAPPVAWDRAVVDGMRRAGVMVPLVDRGGRIHVVLTRRSSDLRDHAGQISFPGGRIEPGDASPQATALREAREEVGLDTQGVEWLGALPAYRTGTGFLLYPSVARISSDTGLIPCPREVAEIFELPLAFALDTANHHPHVIELHGYRYRLAAIPYGDYFIWGATAGILIHLASQLTGQAPLVDPQGERVSQPCH